MHAWGRTVSLLLPLVAFQVSGCAIVDQYSSRAVGFNLEAEQATQQALLLNIVRASYRRPMQFTSIQSITGIASANLTGGLSTIPLGPHSNTAPKIGTLTGSISGGPQFTVPVLDTQEFYQGILNPIPGQVLDLYFNSNYSRELLLDLFIEKVVMRRIDPSCLPTDHSNRCEFTILNFVSNGPHYDIFQSFVEYMLNFGLSTQQIKAPVVKKDEVQLGIYRLCFGPRLAAHHRYIPAPSRCGSPPPAGKQTSERAASYSANLRMPAFVIAGMQSAANLTPVMRPTWAQDEPPISTILEPFKNQPVSLTFYTRHTERLFYYLGEIVAGARDHTRPRTMFRSAQGGLYKDLLPCSYDQTGCEPIMVVEEGLGPASLSVGYNGTIYYIPDAQNVAGRSFFVLDVLKQILALNTSAKSLPASNVISVLSAQ